MRPIETATEVAAASVPVSRSDVAAHVAPGASAGLAVAAAAPLQPDIATRLADIGSDTATITRDLAGLETRVAHQRALAERASGAAAQIERGRLVKLGGEVAAVRERLDALSARVAVAARHAGDVTAALQTVGGLIERADLLGVACRVD